METIKIINLLAKPIWTYKDIMSYDTSVKSPSTAIRIKNRAIKEQNGGVKYGSQFVKTDSVLALYGTSREVEISLLSKANNGEEKL